jgi:hypothetical protein
VPFGSGLVADKNGTFHAMWSEVANGPTNLWTRTISFSRPRQSAALPQIDALADITDRVVSHITNVRFDHLENLISFDLTVTNKSDTPVATPILVIVDDPSQNSGLSASNADNGKAANGAAWELRVSQDVLGCEHDTEPRTLSFHLRRTSNDWTDYPTLEVPIRIYGKLR